MAKIHKIWLQRIITIGTFSLSICCTRLSQFERKLPELPRHQPADPSHISLIQTNALRQTQTQLTNEQSQSAERFAPPAQPERRASQGQPDSDIQMTEGTRNEGQGSEAHDLQSKSEGNKEQRDAAETATIGQSAASTVKVEESEAEKQPFSWL